MVFEQVCTDLETERYEVQPLIIPACSVGAPHLRYRIFIIANRENAWAESFKRSGKNRIYEPETPADDNLDAAKRHGYGKTGQQNEEAEREKNVSRNGFIVDSRDKRTTSDTESAGRKSGNERQRKVEPWRSGAEWNRLEVEPVIRSMDDGFSAGLADISFPSWRRQSIKALGNAVVVPLVYQIFKEIENSTI